MRINKWEVWYASVQYTENKDITKNRPVVIAHTVSDIVSVYYVTTKLRQPAESYPNDYTIVKWSEAGFGKPSYIRLTETLLLSKSDLIEKLGTLSENDILRIMFKTQCRITS